MISLSSLNPAQQEAVVKTEGPVMILAGAGSGKTRTLVTRISYLLSEKDLSPHQLLALTFSNKAAKEMRERVARDVNVDIGTLKITTFHAFCAQLLRTESHYLGLSKNFTIYDEGESKAIVKNLIGRQGLTTKELSPYEVIGYIENIKNNGYYIKRKNNPNRQALFSLDSFIIDEQENFYHYYADYEAELQKPNALDFGGLITAVIELFETYPKVLQHYQERFRYLLVDEYQDTNRAQFALIQMLSAKHQNICVVGDEDQSIYSWRGADIRNILDFEKIFPTVLTLKLEQNYRSSKTIIEAASCVIARNEMRKGKTMWTQNPAGDSIEVVECYNDKQESEYITDSVSKLIKSGVRSDEIAIFYRTNSQSRLFEDNLRKRKIPYRVVGGVKFYERKEIKDMLAYLRLIVNPKDSLALARIINVPTRGLGATSLRKLEQEAVRTKFSLWELVEDLVNNPEKYLELRLTPKIKSALSSFVSIICEAKLLEHSNISPKTIYEKILNESGYLDQMKASKDYESLSRVENLQELSSAISQYESANRAHASLSGFLETITLDSATPTDEENSLLHPQSTGEVSLMTVHGAKGLVFSHVFLAGAEENIFPSYMSLTEGENGVEEERRLFYVAMTRAMKKLCICFAQARMLFGQIKFNGPSRFINEIPPGLFHWRKHYKENFDRMGRDYSDDSDNKDDAWSDHEFSQENPLGDENSSAVSYQVKTTTSTSHLPTSKYPKGAKIVHAIYGKGHIIETEGQGNEEKVLIKFSDGTRKK